MTYMFIDTETGGLDSHKNPLIQLGAAVTDDEFNILETFESLIRPPEGLILEEEALKVNKISLEDLAKAPSEEEVLRAFNSLLIKYDGAILSGFNFQFDMTFIKSACFRNRIALRSQGIIIDLQMAANYAAGLYKFSLKSVCEYFGIQTGNHTALKDALACVEIAKRVL